MSGRQRVIGRTRRSRGSQILSGSQPHRPRASDPLSNPVVVTPLAGIVQFLHQTEQTEIPLSLDTTQEIATKYSVQPDWRSVAWRPSGQGAGLAINRSRVRIPAARLPSATLGKMSTLVSLSPSSIIWYQPMWLGGRVVTKQDLRSTGRGFESRLPGCRVQPWASCLCTCASVTKQYNLVPANGR